MKLPSAPPEGSRDTLRLLSTLIWSILIWVLLWGEVSTANLLWGLVAGSVTLWIVPIEHKTHRLPVRAVPMARFGLVFLWSLIKASAVVAWEIVTPGSAINEGLVAIPLRTTSPGLMTLIANTISLTPGTLTLETRTDPPTLYVHVLHLRDIDDARADIHRLEDVVLRAFAEHPDDRTVA